MRGEPIHFTLGVPASHQQDEFQNATLQSDEGMRVAYSIATHVRVPADVATKGEREVRDFLRTALRGEREALLALLDDLLESADQTGCTDDLTVVSQTAVENLANLRKRLTDAPVTFEVMIGPDDQQHKG